MAEVRIPGRYRGPFRLLLALWLIACVGSAGAAEGLQPASSGGYNVGAWSLGPVLLAIAACVFFGYTLVQRRKRDSRTSSRWSTGAPLQWAILVLFTFFLCCDTAGIVYGLNSDPASTAAVVDGPPARAAALEPLFGPYRDSLREGNPKAILTVTGIVSALNLFGSLSHFILGALLIPIVPFYAYSGCVQGLTLSSSQASTFASMLGFFAVGGLETFRYALCGGAGVHFVLSCCSPAWNGVSTRGESVVKALKAILKLSVVIFVIVVIGALMEALYVQQILLHGGTAMPIKPY